MKQFRLYLLAIVGCLMLTACPSSDGDDDILDEPPTNTNAEINNVHNEPSSKPAYTPRIQK